MATIEQLSAALTKADAAGNSADAKVFADEIRKMRALESTQVTQPKPTSQRDKFLNSLPPDRRAAASKPVKFGHEAAAEALEDERSANWITSTAADISGGLFKGASQIGSTLLWPIDKLKDVVNGTGQKNLSSVITGKEPLTSNQERRQSITDLLGNYVDTDSTAFAGGKLGGEIAGTAGVGGALAKAVPLLSQAPRAVQFANSLRTGGLRIGAPAATTLAGKAADAGIRTAGGGISGGAMAGVVDPENALLGALVGGALPGVANVAGKFGSFFSDNVLKPAANRLMQSAIKPTLKQLKTGEAKIASQTLLDYGINPTARGVEKLKLRIDDINADIAAKLKDSTATVSTNNVLNYLGGVRSKFSNQVSPTSDLSAIQGVADDFAAHPYFKKIDQERAALKEVLTKAQLGKIQALQAAGKLKTFAAQQKSLAHGGGIKLTPKQPENQLYMNVGATGKEVISPSAYPVIGQPRIPVRYTHNIDRVPEGDSGFNDAIAAYRQRKADEITAQSALKQFDLLNGPISVQEAQALKQGTYKALKGKYGEAGSAATEAQKALARGLKDKIADAVPGIGQLNAEEARLLTTLSVSERRALIELNKNPVGLAALAGNPAGFVAFMADRSAAFKSLVARAINKTSKAPALLDRLPAGLENPGVRSGLLATQTE